MGNQDASRMGEGARVGDHASDYGHPTPDGGAGEAVNRGVGAGKVSVAAITRDRYEKTGDHVVQVGISVPTETHRDGLDGSFVCVCADLGFQARHETPEGALAGVRNELVSRLRRAGVA